MATDCSNTLAIREATCKAATDLTDMITGGVNDTSTNYGSKSILGMVKDRTEGASPFFGIDYVWIDSTERTAQTGMVAKEFGYQADTNKVYRYSGSAWELQTTFKIISLDSITGAVGEINSPLFSVNLKNSIELDRLIADGIATYSNASGNGVRTYIDRYGVLQYADIDEPRFEKEGLLLEGVGTNLCAYGDLSVVILSGAAKTLSSQLAPDQTSYAYLVSDDGNGILSMQTFSFVAGTTYTYSIFYKDYGDDANLQITVTSSVLSGGTTSSQFYADGTFTQGTLLDDANMLPLGDGWFRCSVTFTADISATSFNIVRAIVNGNNTGEQIYLWGQQLEASASATSYIPTTGTAVTRSADIFDINLDENIPASNESMSIYTKMSVNAIGGNRSLFNFRYSTDAFDFSLFQAGGDANIILFYYNNLQSNNTNIISNDITKMQSYNFVLDGEGVVSRYNDGVLYANGSYTPTFFEGGARAIGVNSGGTIMKLQELSIYSKALTPTEVALKG